MESALVSLIGRGLLGKAVGDTYEMLKSTYEGHRSSSTVRSVFEELDVFSNMETVASLVGSISHQPVAASEPIEMVVSQIKASIDAIQQDLLEIGHETQVHQQRWFADWRSPFYDGPLKRLRTHHRQLNSRVDMLLKLLPVLGPPVQNSGAPLLVPHPRPVAKLSPSEFDYQWAQ